MKLHLFAICTLFLTTTLLAQNVNIPDPYFKYYLVGNTAINTNGDDEISVAEASSYKDTIDVGYYRYIFDLTGIEAFDNITSLNCSFNQLTKLDVSKNTSLTSLDCSEN